MTFKDKISSFLASIAVAFFVDIKCINYILKAMFNFEEEGGFMPILYLSVIIVLLFVSLLQYKYLMKTNKYVIFILLYILAWYQFTTNVIGVPRVPFQFLCVFTLAAFLTPSIVQIDPKIFTKCVMLLPLVGVFYSKTIFSIQDSVSNTLSLQVSYAFLVPVIATIIYTKFYYRQENYIEKAIGLFAVSVNLIYAYQMLSYGSRGPFLCIISLLLYFIVVKKCSGNGVKLQKNKTLLVLIVGVFVSIFFIETLTFVSSTLHTLGLNFNVIDKSLQKFAEIGNISNGRDIIAGITIKGILEKPLFGYGMDQFENNTGIVYPHNFVLQILYDGGMFFFILFLVPIIYKLYKRIKVCNENEYFLIPFFFFISVPGALLSTDLWYNERLWIFFGVVFASNFISKNICRKTCPAKYK